MAIGDTAAAAGLDLVAGTDMANTLDTELNKILDLIGQIKLNNPNRITSGPTPPTSGRTVGDIHVRVT